MSLELTQEVNRTIERMRSIYGNVLVCTRSNFSFLASELDAPMIFDDSILEIESNGNFESTFYVIPLGAAIENIDRFTPESRGLIRDWAFRVMPSVCRSGMNNYTCPVCFYDKLEEPPADYLICPQCGCEFGVDDFNKSHDELRAEWVAGGSKWWSPVDSEPKTYVCPVCFYDGLRRPPENFLICSQCGTEFGNNDFESTHEELRQKWINSGSGWWSKSIPNPYQEEG